MINFFRRIRKKLADDNKPLKYMRYAIGEIVLVMVGILLALQVNNWNESRKDRVQEIKLYENLIVSLMADSTDVERFSDLISAGMESQRFFINNSCQELIENYTIQQLEDSIEASNKIGASFFPRFKAYDQLSNNGFKVLLQSAEIKTKLTELYERRYRRYLHIDARIDEKSELHLKPIINGDLQIFDENFQMRPANAFDIIKFELYYPELIREFSSIHDTAHNAIDSLKDCKESIRELLYLIRTELTTLKKRNFYY